MIYSRHSPEPPGAGNEGPGEEARLIREAQQGDQRSFEALLRLYDRHVFAIIGSFLRRKQDAEDLAQDVFLKAYLAIGRFRPGAPFAPWLRRITVNTCYDYLRKIRSHAEVTFTDLGEGEGDVMHRLVEQGFPAPGHEVDDQVAARDLAERILAGLAPKDRLVITLREVHGLEIAEIADALGCTRAAAKVRLWRARRAMQARLQGLIRQEEETAERARRDR
ncbi:ECF RNA polymerase sigma-E factor [Candidatus Methylomirabilis lanthanidiphila]|uniref:RNA polymerase sigma factor n=1 Tax=Candidatus Methylomirabilis lanthanidiphila TaxID=2211376 RepID=A0A564ZMB2_9BACT|nr:sigma-70 family RNA polymerase sigma factor [Candidatus Methylomirabilis lanthanidiphila]VUZ86470.1 ECF RNA polymerase sigma-E factor [Candidatus Methylomirabilis lanthanidiphila]